MSPRRRPRGVGVAGLVLVAVIGTNVLLKRRRPRVLPVPVESEPVPPTPPTRSARHALLMALLVVLLPLLVVAGPEPDAVTTSPRAEVISSPPQRNLTTVAAIVRRETERRTAEQLDRVAASTHFAVSAQDQVSGVSFDHGTDRFRAASLVKVHLVALMSWQAERADAVLTAPQRRDAQAMLVRSENDPATRAYAALGGPDGIEQGLEQAFGASGIRIGDQFRWGRSVTSPRDVVALLSDVLDPARATTYALLQRAMTRVIPEQRWGITAAADPETTPQVKVGFSETPAGWIVNSSGRVLVDGSPVLISVMTDRNPSLEAGIEKVEQVARIAREALRQRRELSQGS